MARQPCPECRRDVPVAPWCNRCGARLAEPVHERPGVAGRRWGRLVGAVAVVVGLGVVGVGVATSTGGGGEADRPAEGEVVLDGPAAAEPRTDVVCSDLRVRSIPTAELETTQPGELVELAHGPCVVMGPEGAAVP